MKSAYYISTGSLEVFYTLRYTFDEPRHIQTEHGVECTIIERDYFIQNLALNRDEAIAKAKAIVAERSGGAGHLELDDTFILERQRKAAEAIDWSIFRGGKYTGQSIHQVAEHDRQYLVWLCSQAWTEGSQYRKTAELAAALVAHELNAIAADKAAEAAAVAARVEAAKPVIALFKNLHITVSFIKNGPYFTPCEPFQRESWGAGILVADLEAGKEPNAHVVGSAIDDLLKVEGHSSRGKKAKAAREARYSELETLIWGIFPKAA
jgi:hypothetical protein